ncbi:MAG: efflux RND transporter permease subunit, partial [Proteobacteria bacterium]|nr:efflux RND transporter permease subunit [Pseudomonadota bacterium]
TEISVDFAWGTDMLLAQQLVNTRVNDARRQLPADTSIQIERMTPTVFPVLGLSLRSSKLSQVDLWRYAMYELRPRLSAVPGVARVVLQGGQVPEVGVEVRPDALDAARLSITDVEQALAGTNVVRGVGRVVRDFQQEQVLVSGQMDDLSRLTDVVVTTRGNRPLTLGMLADIRLARQDRTTMVTADGVPAVLLNIVRQPGASTLDVVAGVQKALTSAPRRADTSIGTFYDQSVMIRAAIASVRDAVLLGAVLVVVILLAFLGDLRATVVTAAIIPITILMTLALMRMWGETLNLMTLGALAVGIGLVIDDAIVVVENVFRHLAMGETLPVAVHNATAEIAAP